MKKIINLRRIILLTLFFVLETTKICFADVYISPTEDFLVAVPVLGVALIILTVILVIDLVCMAVGKKNNSEELISKTKKNAEILLYYMLLILGLIIAMFIFSTIFLLSIIPFIAIAVSLFLRLVKKNKKASYLVMGIYILVMIVL